MATILFLFIILVETAFAVFCFITRSEQKPIRNSLRAGAFAAFVLLTAVSVIDWSFRWYPLAFLLCIWAIMGIAGLLRRQDGAGQFKPARRVLKSISTVLLAAAALIPAGIFPQVNLPPATGTHPVETVLFTYSDPNRLETFSAEPQNREVNVQFWYPADGEGRYPLVIFSHGAFGMKISNTTTFQNLASNGYVVCSIDHPYHSLYTLNDQRRLTTVDPTFMQQVSDLNSGKIDDIAGFPIKKGWMDLRTADMHLVLDTILARAGDAGAEEVYRLIDPGKVGLMGHSLGGATAAQVARERDDILAVVNLDGDLMGEYLDERNSLNQEPFPVPILSIFSDDLTTRLAGIPNPEQVVAVKHVTTLAKQGFEVTLTGANHMNLTDLPLISPMAGRAINQSMNLVAGDPSKAFNTVDKMNALVLRFFDAYLKGQGSFAP